MYEYGLGVKQDVEKAIHFYTLAADQEDVVAQFVLAHIYRVGSLVPQNIPEALRFYRLSAGQNYAIAQFALGQIHAQGRIVPQNFEETIRFYTLAKDQGHVGAQYFLGKIYEFDIGIESVDSDVGAVANYRLATEQGFAAAQTRLALMLLGGRGGLLKNEKTAMEAARLVQLAVDQNWPDAQTLLAYMSINGFGGLKKNLGEAIRLYKLAAHQNEPCAQFALGDKYRKGLGVEKNLMKSFRWYLKSKEPFPKELFIESSPFQDNLDIGDDFQMLVTEIMKGRESNNEEGLALLLERHRLKITEEADLHELYQPIIDIEQEAMEMMQALQKAKPGFMVTCVHLTKECENYLFKQKNPPFFSFHALENSKHLTLGEENGVLATQFVSFCNAIGTKFRQVDQLLFKIVGLHEERTLHKKVTGYACPASSPSELPDDLGYGIPDDQQLVTNQLNEEDSDIQISSSTSSLAENQSSLSVNISDKGFRADHEEIEAHRAMLKEIQKKIKSLSSRGLGSRNAAVLEEYPELRIEGL